MSACLLTVLLLFVGSQSFATQVTGLAALHHDGQTFLTWTAPAGTGWTYRAYASAQIIDQTGDLATATLLGAVGDSTWCDRRLSSLSGAIYAYAIDSLAAPLGATNGLFAVTPAASSSRFYAVTAERAPNPEDRTITLGQNSLATPVAEALALPRPVFQRSLVVGGIPVAVYALWTSAAGTALFPAMANEPGVAHDCGVVRGGAPPQNSLMIRPHARGGSFLQSLAGSGESGEWRLALDDHLRSSERNSFWYGYHERYDIESSSNLPPVSGTVVDYTMRRVVFTVEWARRNFPIDPARVYAMGGSMGGIGSILLAFRRPDLVAAVHATVPKFDFAFLNDPNPANVWNAGGPERAVGDRLWGAVATNLPSSEGIAVYERLNDGFLAGAAEAVSIPPIIAFNGKNDTVVGWAEKIGFYEAMRLHRLGGYFFWDQRAHGAGPPAAWSPMQSARYLYRFRADRSFPALSNASADQDPGDGHAASGDSVGAINAFVEWNTTLVDEPGRWETTLTLRDLATLWGTMAAPDSATVDVTPRRLQAFEVAAGESYAFEVMRVAGGAVVQSGTVAAGDLGLVTVPAVKVFRAGSRLRIEPAAPDGVPGSEAPAPGAPAIVLAANPVSGPCEIRITWRGRSGAEVLLAGVSGRVERVLARLDRPPAVTTLRLDPHDLARGVYVVVARQGGARAAQRLIILR